MKKFILWIAIVIILIIAITFVYVKLFEKKALVISKGKMIESYQAEKAALLVVDIQEGITGFLSTKECYTKGSDAFIQKIDAVIEKSKEDSMPVIYVRNEITDWFINLLNNTYEKGNPGAGFDRRLTIVSDLIVTKEKNDAFSNPILDSILIKNKISKLFVVGLDVAHCVNSTIYAAMNRGYKITVISDAVASESDTLKARMLKEFALKKVELLTTGEFISKGMSQ